MARQTERMDKADENPCARCDHGYGRHVQGVGRCATDGCPCGRYIGTIAIHGDEPVRVVPAHMIDEPYIRRSNGLSTTEQRAFHWRVVKRLEDGNYLVLEP